MIARLKHAALALLTGIGLLWAAWLAGRREGTRNARAGSADRNVKAAHGAKENRHELESQDDQHIVDILTGGRKLRD